MKTVVRVGAVIIVAAVLVGAGFFFWQRRNETAEADVAAPTFTVTQGGIEEAVSATGNVSPERLATLAFETSGSIAEVLVNEGQQVEAGEVLARLDTTSLEWELVRLQASLDTAQARLEQAQEPASEEDLASARVALDSARANYEDVKDGASAEEIASAQASLDSAIANLKNVKDGASAEEIASAQASLDSAIANLRKVKAGPTKEELASAKASVDSAQASVQQAQSAYDRIKSAPDAAMRQEALELEQATISLEQAQASYRDLVNHPTKSELASAQAQVAQAESTLATLVEPSTNELASADAQVAQAESNLATLLDRPSTSELAAADAQVAQAEASLAALLARPNAEDVAIQQAQLEEATIALAQARDQQDDVLVTAPFAGSVLEVSVTEGEWASPGAPAIVLATVHPLILDVDVDEVDVAQLREGQSARLSFDALRGGEIVGTVTLIAPASSDVGGAVAYGVEVSFEPGELPVRLGMTADVDIITSSVGDALLVPNRAVEADREQGRYYVTKLRGDGTTERVEVEIGIRNEAETEILQGVAVSDELVLPVVPEQGEAAEDQFGPGGGGGPFGGGNGH
ncbi:efflux RND transporter periplasmic adaptor subunit [Chloroflexota bacterium]